MRSFDKGGPRPMLARMGKTTFDRCNCLAVRQAARRVTQLYDSHLGPLGLRATQYSVLSHLRTLGALSINIFGPRMNAILRCPSW